MKRVWVALMFGFASTVAVAADVIPHNILNRSVTAGGVPSFDVEVQPIGDRLPNEEELGALSNHLVEGDSRDRKFVLFNLPGMVAHLQGARSTASIELHLGTHVASTDGTRSASR